MANFSELIASFDTDSGKRGKQFEYFVKWFLNNDPEWCTQIDKIWLWSEYPERWGIDCGIDLVFRHKNGQTWAVQAKCYSKNYSITKQDVDKFLSESNRKGIEKRLLITTTDGIGANAKQVCEAQEKQVIRYMLSNFEAANLEYPPTINFLHTAKRKTRPTPREHQFEAINEVVDGLMQTDRGQLIMACGTGKTFTTLWIKEKLNATSTLILLPSLGLLSQTLNEWTLAANFSFEVLCVCSDESVGKKDSDEAINSVADFGFPVTSKVEEIIQFLTRDGAKVVFCTYQSSSIIAEAHALSTISDFDLAIADEAHRCAGKAESNFSIILNSNKIRAKKRLFTTATPRTYSVNVQKKAEKRGIDIVGMDDKTIFGTVLYSLTFGEAIKRGLLTDYQVIIIGVDNNTIANWITNRELVKTEYGSEKDAESLAAQIGILKAFKDYDLRRVISFHTRVAGAEKFSKDLLEVFEWIGEDHKPSGKLQTAFVSGKMSADKRRAKLRQLKELESQERRLITNARCLSEGVDVPSLDGIAFIDPRSSQIDIIQAVGRAIRLSDNKMTGTIILPVFIKDSSDIETALENSTFKPIWDVINALKAHDDILSAELDNIRMCMGSKSIKTIDRNYFSKIRIDLPTKIDNSFAESLSTQLVIKTSDSWEYWFGMLQKYTDDHKNSSVPQAYIEANGYKLGYWVATQIQRRNYLSFERQARLEALPGWTWNRRDEAWENSYSELRAYSLVNGNCFVTAKYLTSKGRNLQTWITTQIVNKDIISEEKKALLESLPGWTWNRRDEAWDEGLSLLKDYSLTNGNCLVPKNYVAINRYKLGQWVSKQRVRRDDLPPDRKSQLESIAGWTWSSLDEAWEIGFSHLFDYISEKGDSLVPFNYICNDGFRLGTWISTQRSTRKEMQISRQARLSSLPGWAWNKHEGAWEIGFIHLNNYMLEHGNCSVPAAYELANGYKLGVWVQTQRTSRTKMSQDRQLRLASLHGWIWKSQDINKNANLQLFNS